MQVALFHGRGVISWLIRSQTRGIYSHAGIYDEERDVLYESWQGKGVQKTKLSPGPGIHLYRIIGLDDWQKELVREYWERHIEKKTPYDYRGVVRFVTRNRRGFEVPGEERSLFCSEGAYNSLGYAKFWLFSHREGHLVSPYHLSWSPRITL